MYTAHDFLKGSLRTNCVYVEIIELRQAANFHLLILMVYFLNRILYFNRPIPKFLLELFFLPKSTPSTTT